MLPSSLTPADSCYFFAGSFFGSTYVMLVGQYRCMTEMRALLGWLRTKGIVSPKPLHTLRKEFGSLINVRYGLLAASEQLRHGGIGVTAKHYLENRQPSVLGLGHLLKGERTIIPIDREAARYPPPTAAFLAGNHKKPVFDFRSTFVTLRPWKRTLAASDAGPTPQRAKSDFLSVV
jgi:hypothetical protein